MPVVESVSWRRRSVAVAMLVSLALLATALAVGSADRARIVVLPAGARFDEPLMVRVTGLRAASNVELTIQAQDVNGVTWSASASFTADREGVVDTATAAPVAGDYLGVSASGLLSRLQPSDVTAESFGWPSRGPAVFEVRASVNGRLLTATTERIMWPEPPTVRTFVVAKDSFAGTYLRPAEPSAAGPAVLVVGGTGGGDPRYGAEYFAARGIPALSVAYFGAPGLPPSLANIAVEYFDAPLRWLRSQTGVDPHRIWIVGVSAGSEAAALVAAARPDLVHGAMVIAPSSTAHCSFAFGCPTPSWLQARQPVPSTAEFDVTEPSDNPAAILPVERIPGPVLVACGGSDLVWNSCLYGAAILQRRHERGLGAHDVLLDYPEAGHGLILLAPYDPRREAPPEARMGGAANTDNDHALANAWPQIREFIGRR